MGTSTPQIKSTLDDIADLTEARDWTRTHVTDALTPLDRCAARYAALTTELMLYECRDSGVGGFIQRVAGPVFTRRAIAAYLWLDNDAVQWMQCRYRTCIFTEHRLVDEWIRELRRWFAPHLIHRCHGRKATMPPPGAMVAVTTVQSWHRHGCLDQAPWVRTFYDMPFHGLKPQLHGANPRPLSRFEWWLVPVLPLHNHADFSKAFRLLDAWYGPRFWRRMMSDILPAPVAPRKTNLDDLDWSTKVAAFVSDVRTHHESLAYVLFSSLSLDCCTTAADTQIPLTSVLLMPGPSWSRRYDAVHSICKLRFQGNRHTNDRDDQNHLSEALRVALFMPTPEDGIGAGAAAENLRLYSNGHPHRLWKIIETEMPQLKAHNDNCFWVATRQALYLFIFRNNTSSITCPVCMDHSPIVTILPCGHILCNTCSVACVAQEDAGHGSVKCPMCRCDWPLWLPFTLYQHVPGSVQSQTRLHHITSDVRAAIMQRKGTLHRILVLTSHPALRSIIRDRLVGALPGVRITSGVGSIPTSFFASLSPFTPSCLHVGLYSEICDTALDAVTAVFLHDCDSHTPTLLHQFQQQDLNCPVIRYSYRNTVETKLDSMPDHNTGHALLSVL